MLLATPLTFSPQMDYWSSSTQSYCISFGTGRSGFCYNFLSTILKPGVDDCCHSMAKVLLEWYIVVSWYCTSQRTCVPVVFLINLKCMKEPWRWPLYSICLVASFLFSYIKATHLPAQKAYVTQSAKRSLIAFSIACT